MIEPKGPLGKAAVILMTVWFLLGVVPVLSQMFGVSFLPSTEWISRTSTHGLIAGIATALLAFWIAWNSEEKDDPDSYVKWFFGNVGALFFGFFIGQTAVVIAGPMIIALFAGHQIELPFTVLRADSIGSKWCRNSAELEDLMSPFDSICGVPDFVRRGLTPGTRIVVTGHGTELGLYVKRLRRAG